MPPSLGAQGDQKSNLTRKIKKNPDGNDFPQPHHSKQYLPPLLLSGFWPLTSVSFLFPFSDKVSLWSPGKPLNGDPPGFTQSPGIMGVATLMSRFFFFLGFEFLK